MKKEWVILGFVLCVLAGFAAGLLVKWPAGMGPARGGLVLTHPIKGPADALVKIVEISDFECPYCSKAAHEVLPEVLKMYPGRVAVEFWQNPLEFHKGALPAAKASMAAHLQGRFWEMHDFLFRNQKTLSMDQILAGARQLGLDMDRFQWDMADVRIEEFIANDRAAVGKVGLKGTPMFVINGKVIQGAQPPSEFAKVIDEELADAEAALAAGTSREDLASTLSRQNQAGDEFIKYFVEGKAAFVPTEKKKISVDDSSDRTVWKVPVDPSDPAIGPASAPLTVVVFSDFQCPYSGQSTAILKRVLEDYSGDVRVVFKNFPLPFHKEAFAASEAGLAAAAQGRFWLFHDLLFANQRSMGADSLERLADEAGLDVARFRTDMEKHAYKAVVERHLQEGRDVGVKGTPNFFINGRVVKGAVSWEEISPVLASALAEGKEAVAAGAADPYSQLVENGKTFVPFADEPATLDSSAAPFRGGDNPEIELVLFSDFQCPHCRAATKPLFELLDKYGERARLAFRQFPLKMHPSAHLAAQAALAANAQGRFWEMHDKLFDGGKELGRKALDEYAAELGLDTQRFARELDAGTWRDAVDKDLAEGQRNGVRGTPTLFVNGRMYRGGLSNPGELANAIDRWVL